MNDLQILIHDKETKISSSLNEEYVLMALGSRIFTEWRESLDARFSVSAITIQAIDFRGQPSKENVMFVRLKAKTMKPFEEIIELRGGTVVLLPIFICEGMRFTVLVKQPRIATGKYELAELPAGMIDGGTFSGAAARELQEELGVTYEENELIELTAHLPGAGNAIFFSPGLLDEKARFYMAERVITNERLSELQGKATGLLEEGEIITLWVVPFDEITTHTSDGKTFIALQLYTEWKRRHNK